MIRRLGVSTFFVLGLFIASYGQHSENRKVGFYDELKVSHGIEVVLVKGSPGTIMIITDGVDFDDIITEVEWETLKIRFRNVSIWDDDKFDRRNVRIEVPFDHLDFIDVGTGAVVETQSVIRGDELRLDIGTGGEIDLEINVDNLRADITMGAIADIEGRARSQRTKVSMGAVVDFRDLETEFATVKANMGGEIRLTASKEVDASAGMGGLITVYGSPDKRYVSDSFGGEIHFKKIN